MTDCGCDNCQHPELYVPVPLTTVAAAYEKLVPSALQPDAWGSWSTCGPVPDELRGVVFGHSGLDYVRVRRDTLIPELETA